MINHIAFVMDGNRRWAKKRGLIPYQGHVQGVESVRKVIEFFFLIIIYYNHNSSRNIQLSTDSKWLQTLLN